jgi:putative hydrolase of the HAD superfamily
MPRHDFRHVKTWVFDLDNTLYPPSARLFDQIEAKMTDWVMARLQVGREHADQLRRHYWALYGTTLAGLMAEHDIAPGEYLSAVHDIDFSPLLPDPVLAARLAALPGRRIVHTNADAAYARRVLKARGLADLFDAIYGVEETLFHPKPARAAFDAVLAADGLDPGAAAMFEDDPRNLAVPHDLGMRTVHIAPERLEAPHIHHHAEDLSEFLARLVES